MWQRVTQAQSLDYVRVLWHARPYTMSTAIDISRNLLLQTCIYPYHDECGITVKRVCIGKTLLLTVRFQCFRKSSKSSVGVIEIQVIEILYLKYI